MRIALTLVLAVGCTSPMDEDTPCETFGQTVCDVACDCDPGCRVQMGALTASFDSTSDCLGFYRTLGCREEDPTFDYEACAALVADAECMSDAEGGFIALDTSSCHE